MKKLGVVIVTYNRLELLKECIYNCINQSYKFNKIIIVNNASSDGTEEYLRHLTYDNVVIVTSKENFGGAGGYYLGVKEAKKIIYYLLMMMLSLMRIIIKILLMLLQAMFMLILEQ